MSVLKRFTSWSHSRRADYEACPRAAKLKHLDKLPVPGSPAMDRGAAIGKMCEDYVSGTLIGLPEELEHFGPEFEELQAAYKSGKSEKVWIEEMWGFDAEWRPVHWKAWDVCRVRVKCDLVRLLSPNHLLVVDYKTGKYRPDAIDTYVDQLELYAVGGLCKFENVKRVSTRLAYLDHGVTYPERDGAMEFDRSQLDDLIAKQNARVAPMLADVRFDPKPGNACRWCHFKKSNGGPCEF